MDVKYSETELNLVCTRERKKAREFRAPVMDTNSSGRWNYSGRFGPVYIAPGKPCGKKSEFQSDLNGILAFFIKRYYVIWFML